MARTTASSALFGGAWIPKEECEVCPSISAEDLPFAPFLRAVKTARAAEGFGAAVRVWEVGMSLGTACAATWSRDASGRNAGIGIGSAGNIHPSTGITKGNKKDTAATQTATRHDEQPHTT